MRPPESDEARVAAGSGEAAKRTAGTAKPTVDPRELQGIRTRRNRDQRAPAWPTPRGAAAAADLNVVLRSWTALLGRAPIDPLTKRGPR